MKILASYAAKVSRNIVFFRKKPRIFLSCNARVVKLVYTLVLGTSAVRREGSIPFSRTTQKQAKVAELVDALDSKSSE